MTDAFIGIAFESFALLARMAPYLLLGIIVAGALHVLVPMGFVAKQLGNPGWRSVFKAAAIGVPLPLCSCGVVPVAASLKKSGASHGAVTSFLISTPTTGVDSILATYSLLGGAMAVARVAASFVIGLAAGIATSLGLKGAPNSQVDDNLDREPEDESEPKGNLVLNGAVYAFGELFGGIAKPLAIGGVLGGAIAYFLPPGVLEQYIGRGFISYLVMMAVGIPLYVCASGSIPLAAALLAKGISPGAALVFLIAGPATNTATIAVVSRMIGKRGLAIYLASIAIGSLAFGAVTDAFFLAFPSFVPAAMTGSHNHEASGLSTFELAGGIGLCLIVAYHIVKPVVARRRTKEKAGVFQLKVPDMTCQHCAGSIKSAVLKLDGVRKVDADPATKIVNVDMEDSANRDAVVNAIADAGFHPEKT